MPLKRLIVAAGSYTRVAESFQPRWIRGLPTISEDDPALAADYVPQTAPISHSGRVPEKYNHEHSKCSAGAN